MPASVSLKQRIHQGRHHLLVARVWEMMPQ
jgi:hypothetical protein